MSQTNDLLVEISTKLDKVLRLLAVDVVKEYGKEHEKIELLDSLGFRAVEIAKLLNKTPENVNVVLSSIRKKKLKTSAKKDVKNTKTQEMKAQESG